MKRFSLSPRSLGLVALAALWMGCSGPRLEVPPLPPPPAVSPDAPSVTLRSFRASIREGVVIGRHSGGPLRWTALMNQSRYEEVGRRELRALGFPGPEVEGDPFEAELADARYWIAATLVEWRYDVYTVLGNPVFEGIGRFHWQVYDTTSQDILLEHTGGGYASVPEENVLEYAFLDGLRRFAAVPAFAALFTEPAAQP